MVTSALTTSASTWPEPTLDQQARSEYRQRITELRADLEPVVSDNDLGRTETLQRELSALTRQLAEGMSGSRRKAERARQRVAKGIVRGIQHIREAHPALAEHLTASVRHGPYCSYRPDRRLAVRWMS